MAGSHRATRVKERSRVSGRVAGITIAVAMVPLGWFAADRVFNSAGDSSIPGTSGPTTAPSTAPTTAPSSTPTTEPTAKPSPPALPRIAPSAPRRLASGTVLDVGFANAIEPRNGSLRPTSTDEVARWRSRGMPGSPGTDTVYIVGSTRANGDSAFAALPRLEAGAKLTIRTDRGRMTYTVTSAADRPTGGLANNDDFAAKVPGRLILVGVRVDESGESTGRAYVVVATLTAARTS